VTNVRPASLINLLTYLLEYRTHVALTCLVYIAARRWFDVNGLVYKKLIRRWDSERELSLRRYRTHYKIQ